MDQNQVNFSAPALGKTFARQRSGLELTGLSGAERALVVDRLYREAPTPLLVVLSSIKEAETFLQDLSFLGGSCPVPAVLFPPYNLLPFKRLSFHGETAARRIRNLYRLVENDPPPVVVTTASALMQRVLPKGELCGYADLLQEGQEIDREELVAKLIAGGYTRAAIVEEPGDFCVRGAIMDVFTPRYEDPIRIEQFGDLVESIRFFSAASQRTLESIQEAVILPAREAIIAGHRLDEVCAAVRTRGAQQDLPVTRIRSLIEEIRRERTFPGIEGLLPLIFQKLDTILDYLPQEGITVCVEPATLEGAADAAFRQTRENFDAAVAEARLCVEPDALYLDWEGVQRQMASRPGIAIKALAVETGGDPGPATRIALLVQDNGALREKLKIGRDKERPLAPLAEWIEEKKRAGLSVVLSCRTKSQAERIRSLLTPYLPRLDIAGHFPDPPLAPGVARIVVGQVSTGFVWPSESVALVTEDEIFGPRQRQRAVSRRSLREQLLTFEDLQQGDLIVHSDHGVGRYEGLVKLNLEGVSNDFLLILYRDGDKLYLPVDRMGNVHKYLGVESVVPSLDKMGGKSWERIKKQVKKSAEKIAGELLGLYAARKVKPGFAFHVSGEMADGFEAGFAYEETPDQLRAIEEVIGDMAAPHCMDRLICGDVGYGKTEVALRAAFMAVANAKQVAVLVPTTVLAEQHFETFRNRFENYPVRLACLSRFRAVRHQKEIIQELKSGKIDIVIGTHRLLQKDIGFKDLGLVVLDEEQRFGVRHKEKLKRFRDTVDVLALTATPIPRTLHLSLMGIRDISVISTPPEHRHPIITYISEFSDAVIRESVRKEMGRKGQVFFVFNSVRGIERMAEKVKALVPEARVAVGHAQLREGELEKVMFRFVNREVDVLVCTTIIESGLDIPSANTIIVNRADRFGLAQMYQLRGRVGRAEEQAYAYLFIPSESALGKDAQKRLKVLMEYSDLGSGFQIAMNDLKIRGGGTILGASQSGHIAAVGYDMFLKLMEESISELKGESVQKPLDPEINVDMSAFLPEDYVPAIDQRLSAYRRLSRFTELREIAEFKDELVDRFGPLPQEAENLMLKMMLRMMAIRAGIQRLDFKDGRLSLVFSMEHMQRPEALVAMVQTSGGVEKLTPEGILVVDLGKGSRNRQMAEMKKILKEIALRVN